MNHADEFSIAEKAKEISLKAETTSRELRHAASIKRLEGYSDLADQLEACAVEVDALGVSIREASAAYQNGISGVLALITTVASETHEKLSKITAVVTESQREKVKN